MNNRDRSDSVVSDIPPLSDKEEKIVDAIKTYELEKVKNAVQTVGKDSITNMVLGTANTYQMSSKSMRPIYEYLRSEASQEAKDQHAHDLGFRMETSEYALLDKEQNAGRKTRKSKKTRKGKSKKSRKSRKSRASRRV